MPCDMHRRVCKSLSGARSRTIGSRRTLLLRLPTGMRQWHSAADGTLGTPSVRVFWR